MQKVNYGLILEKKLEEIEKSGLRPTLLLHACCAPCSSYVLEYLSDIFDITLLYYNPNISPQAEHQKRANELEALSKIINHKKEIPVIIGAYEPEKFQKIAKGLEALPEGGERCERCYRLRLSQTASYAKEMGFDYFTTTLSISPHKDAEKLNSIGGELAEKFGCSYLFSDFKKKGGYLRSCQLSKEFGLYRQDYCGCIYSKSENY